MPVWTELTIIVPNEYAEVVSSFLFDHGSTGVEEEERDGLVRLKAYFSSDPPLVEVERYAREIGAFATGEEVGEDILSLRTVDQEDWAETWRLHFEPLFIGKRLFVCPPWTEERPDDRIAIVIDPGMAFGTGQHASTRLCLELAEAIVDERQVSTAMDIGSGSGILSIALAKLGVPRIWALEIDPLAREATDVNAASNDVAAAITTLGSVDEVPARVDLVVANLFTRLLRELAPVIAVHTASGGSMVCSGFINTDAAQVEDVLCAAGFRVRERRSDGVWAALALERQ